MQKFTAWLRRHKTKFLDFGILLGLALLAWAFVNAPVNINRMTDADWHDTKIQSIGTATVQKLQANSPYADMQDIDRVTGIGPVKMAQIQRHFTTWDTAKADVWFHGFLIALILAFGCGLIRYFVHRDRAEAVKKFEHRLGIDDKNVKR